MRIITYLSGIAMFCLGIYFFKTSYFFPGLVLVGSGLVMCWGVELIPYSQRQKFKLKDKHIEEIKKETRKDTLVRELVFLENEKTEELVSLVDELSFEDALIVIKSIETKYPQLTIGRGIEL